MSLDAIRKTKHETWCTGVEAFADVVQKCFDTAMEACDANDIADVEEPSWQDVKGRLAKLATAIAAARDLTFTYSPFLPLELKGQVEGKTYRAFGAPPPMKEDFSSSIEPPMKSDATNKRRRRKAAASAKGASEDLSE